VYEAGLPVMYLYLIYSGSTVAGWTPINQPCDSELDSPDEFSRATVKEAESSEKLIAKANKPSIDANKTATRKRPSRAKSTRQSLVKKQKTISVSNGPQQSSTAVSSSSRASPGPVKPGLISTSTLEKLEAFRFQVGPGSGAPYKDADYGPSVAYSRTSLNNDGLGSSIVASDSAIDIDGFDEFGMIDDEDLMHLEIPLGSNESDSEKLSSQSNAISQHKTTLNNLAENFHRPVQSCPGLDPFDDMENEFASLDDNDLLQLIDLTEGACHVRVENPTNQYTSQRGNIEAKGTTVSTSSNRTKSAMKSVKSRPPILRPPFPPPVQDRSPIHGVSAATNLRTCFRVGEALNSGVFALHNNKDIVIELYARVVSSHREDRGVRQHFVFADLFHDRPPFLNGEYDLWKGSTLWDYDSKRFLDPQDPTKQKLCRCVGRVKKVEKDLKFTVLNIWEASWDDVKHVKGIVCASR
jgi:hypothetical protein